jgi:hypothetical protein
MKIVVEKKEQLPNSRTPVVYHFPETNERLTYLAKRIGPAAREMSDCFLYEGDRGSFEFLLHHSHGELYASISPEIFSLPTSHPRYDLSGSDWWDYVMSKEVHEYEIKRYPWSSAPVDPTFVLHFLEMIRQIAIQGCRYGSNQDYVVAVMPRSSEYGYPRGPATYLLDPHGFYESKY